MVGCIYLEKYKSNNTQTEIFYDFHNEPVIIYEDEKNIKANHLFVKYFGRQVKSKKMSHHSQMLTEITNADDILLEFYNESIVEKISLAQVLKQQKELNQKELILRKKSGDRIFMFAFRKLENIHTYQTVCVFKDTTHFNQLQKVKSQVEVRSIIMGCLTHELRTPVNCAMSILKSLEDYIQNSQEAKKLLLICQGTIEMLRSLTEDFIDFTRYENKKGLPIKKEPIDIRSFFESVKNIFGFQAEEKNLRFDVNISKNVPVEMNTDPKRLKQVMMNLLSNSFKFTLRGKIEINLFVKKSTLSANKDELADEVKLRMSKSKVKESCFDSRQFSKKDIDLDYADTDNLTDDKKMVSHLFIEVIDTGIGMTDKVRKNLFTKFASGNNSKGLNTNGLGLGLYLSKQIVTRLDGDISCKSIFGIGSTFVVKIPLDSKHELKELLAFERIPSKNKANMKISKSYSYETDEFDEFEETRAGTANQIQSSSYIMSYSSNCLNMLTEKAESRKDIEKVSEINSDEVKLEVRKNSSSPLVTPHSNLELQIVKK